MPWNPLANIKGPQGPAGGAADVQAAIQNFPAGTIEGSDRVPFLDMSDAFKIKMGLLGSAALAPIVGTVAQVAGVPSGAIMQRGSNANGEFVRLADGTQVCWRIFNMPSSQTVAAESYWNGASWTFPAAFLAIPTINMNCFGSNGGYFVPTFSYLTASVGGDVFIMNTKASATTFSGQIHQFAIGRWF